MLIQATRKINWPKPNAAPTVGVLNSQPNSAAHNPEIIITMGSESQNIILFLEFFITHLISIENKKNIGLLYLQSYFTKVLVCN